MNSMDHLLLSSCLTPSSFILRKQLFMQNQSHMFAWKGFSPGFACCQLFSGIPPFALCVFLIFWFQNKMKDSQSWNEIKKIPYFLGEMAHTQNTSNLGVFIASEQTISDSHNFQKILQPLWVLSFLIIRRDIDCTSIVLFKLF